MRYSQQDIQTMQEDFRSFVWCVWRALKLPPPTDIQLEIADTLQNKPSHNLVIMGFRGVAKSYITCTYAVWRLWLDKELKLLLVSASRDKVAENGKFIRNLISHPDLDFLHSLDPSNSKQQNRYKSIFANRNRTKVIDTQVSFDIAGCTPTIAPSVKIVGISGQLTGSRANIIIADDVEVPNNSGTVAKREQLLQKIAEFEDVIVPGGEIIYLGTPQSESSIYNQLRNNGYTCRIWPLLYPTPDEMHTYGDDLAPSIANKVRINPLKWAGLCTEPGRFSAEDIARRKAKGKARFKLQYMLDTTLADVEQYPLKTSDLIIHPLSKRDAPELFEWNDDPDNALDLPNVGINDKFYKPHYFSDKKRNYSQIYMAIDPSGRGRDETAYAIGGYVNGYVCILECGGYSGGGYGENVLEKLAFKCSVYNVKKVILESNFGDGMYAKLLAPILKQKQVKAEITEVRNYLQKEKRIIDTLEPVMLQHKLVINTQIIVDDYAAYEHDPEKSLIYQMTRLTAERGSLTHDDRLDALCILVDSFKEKLKVDSKAEVIKDDKEFLELAMRGSISDANAKLRMKENPDLRRWLIRTGSRTQGNILRRN